MTSPTLADDRSIIDIRELYYGASTSSALTESFISRIKTVPTDTPVIKGYRGMGYLLQASHAFNPYSKLKYFREGRDILEQAIQEAPKDPELRFLRYSVQTNAPFFLGYSDSIQEDEKLLKEYIKGSPSSKGDEDLHTRVTRYLRDRNAISD